MSTVQLKRRKRIRFNSAYLFIAPSLLLIGVFIAEPIVQSLWMSLHDWTIGGAHQLFTGLSNYASLLGDGRFWNALKVTVIYTVCVAVGQVGFGLAIASRLRRTTWYSSVIRVAYFFPFIGALAVVGVVWKFLLDPQVGLLAAWASKLGFVPIAWLQSTTWALPALIAVGIWKNVGFAMIIILAGMQGVPDHLYEAATMDGAGAWGQFIHITMPSLRPTLLFAMIIATINGLQLFDLNYVMTNGGPLFHTESVVMYLYQRGFIDFRMGYATAIAWILFLVIMVISFAQLRLMRYKDVD